VTLPREMKLFQDTGRSSGDRFEEAMKARAHAASKFGSSRVN